MTSQSEGFVLIAKALALLCLRSPTSAAAQQQQQQALFWHHHTLQPIVALENTSEPFGVPEVLSFEPPLRFLRRGHGYNLTWNSGTFNMAPSATESGVVLYTSEPDVSFHILDDSSMSSVRLSLTVTSASETSVQEVAVVVGGRGMAGVWAQAADDSSQRLRISAFVAPLDGAHRAIDLRDPLAAERGWRSLEVALSLPSDASAALSAPRMSANAGMCGSGTSPVVLWANRSLHPPDNTTTATVVAAGCLDGYRNSTMAMMQSSLEVDMSSNDDSLVSATDVSVHMNSVRTALLPAYQDAGASHTSRNHSRQAIPLAKATVECGRDGYARLFAGALATRVFGIEIAINETMASAAQVYGNEATANLTVELSSNAARAWNANYHPLVGAGELHSLPLFGYNGHASCQELVDLDSRNVCSMLVAADPQEGGSGTNSSWDECALIVQALDPDR